MYSQNSSDDKSHLRCLLTHSFPGLSLENGSLWVWNAAQEFKFLTSSPR